MNSYDFSTMTITKDTATYASWKYNITYGENGGSAAPAADTKVHGIGYTIAGVGTMSKTGYDFVCWNTQTDGKGTDYTVGATYAADEPLALYAKWLAVNQYVKFSSTETFTLKVHDGIKSWDGTLQYSTDAASWTTWDGTEISSSMGKVLYLRGFGNSIITGYDNESSFNWVLTGTQSISCTGNIETLLDCNTIATGGHPTMGKACYNCLFLDCDKLTSAPSLPATTLAEDCYQEMFRGCTGLSAPPALPAETLAVGCYWGMFYGCTKLTKAPALPATTLAEDCCESMFQSCTGLSSLPALPANTMVWRCYSHPLQGLSLV